MRPVTGGFGSFTGQNQTTRSTFFNFRWKCAALQCRDDRLVDMKDFISDPPSPFLFCFKCAALQCYGDCLVDMNMNGFNSEMGLEGCCADPLVDLDEG